MMRARRALAQVGGWQCASLHITPTLRVQTRKVALGKMRRQTALHLHLLANARQPVCHVAHVEAHLIIGQVRSDACCLGLDLTSG